MSVKLEAYPSQKDTPIAFVKGGPWARQTVVLAKKTDPEAESGFVAPDKSEFFPACETRPSQRDVLFVIGPSGSGKSTFANQYAKTFVRQFTAPVTVSVPCEAASDDEEPEFQTLEVVKTPRVIVVCSSNPCEDPAYEGLKVIWVQPSELANDAKNGQTLTLEEWRDPYDLRMLFIFDDVEAVANKAELKAVEDLESMLLLRARKSKIYVLVLSHHAAKGNRTKTILAEMTGFWMATGGHYGRNMSYFLKDYAGISPDLRQEFHKNAVEWGHWVYFRRSIPRFVISPKRCLSFDEEAVEEALKTRRLIARRIADANAHVAVDAALKKSHAPIRDRLAGGTTAAATAQDPTDGDDEEVSDSETEGDREESLLQRDETRAGEGRRGHAVQRGVQPRNGSARRAAGVLVEGHRLSVPVRRALRTLHGGVGGCGGPRLP